jgi:hypothetical protein
MAKTLKTVGTIATTASFVAMVVPGGQVFAAPLRMIGALSYLGGTYLVSKEARNDRNSLDPVNFTYKSPRYRFGALETQVNNTLARPMLYGQNKVAGNMLWHSGGDNETIKKIVGYGDGPINSFSGIELDNIPIGELSGCSYSDYTGNGSQSIDSRVPGSSDDERAAKVGGLKYEAYLAVTAQASDRLNNSYFTVSAVVQGRKVRVYSDTSTYSTEYSDNPAWCILDFLTAYNACRLDHDEIDLQSFIDAADYCDEQVDGQDRFTLNLVCDHRKSNLDWLHEMLIACRGYIVYQDGKIYLQIEQAGSSVHSFDSDNIIDGSEKFWTVPSENQYDIVKVRYIDPDNEYARILAVAEYDEFSHDIPVVHELEAFGVDNFEQASRLAWFYLNQAKTCNKLISFATTKEGLDLTVGDIIDITSTFLGYTSKDMRVILMREAQEGQIEITCKEYNVNLYNDTLGSVEPTIDVITLPNALNKPPQVSGVSISEVGWRNRDGVHIANLDVSWNAPSGVYKYSYLVQYSTDGGSTYKTAGTSADTDFRITGVQPNQAYRVSVQAMNTAGTLSDRTTEDITPVGKDENPDEVTGFTVTTDVLDRTRLKFSWTRVDIVDLRGYEIREGLTWDSGTAISSVLYDTEKAEYEITESRAYKFWIKAVDNSYNYSDTAASVDVTGSIYPDAVTNFQAVQNGEEIALSWNKVTNSDLAGYEIRLGKSFNSGQLVVNGIKNNFYNVNAGQEKTYYFTIKAVNNAGNYSQSAASTNIVVGNLPTKNVINTYEELSLQSGSHDGTSFSQNTNLWSTLTGTWDSYTTQTWDSFGGSAVLRLGEASGPINLETDVPFLLESGQELLREIEGDIPTSGTYTCAQKDMGQVITAKVSADFESSVGTDSDLSAKLQFRTSNDASTWSDWKDFVDAKMTFRYIEFRVVMTTADTSKTPYVTVCTIYIDVPDYEEVGSATIAAGGTTVSYDHTYYSTPAAFPTAVGDDRYADLQSQSETGFVCKVRKISDGSDVGGTVNWRAIGY